MYLNIFCISVIRDRKKVVLLHVNGATLWLKLIGYLQPSNKRQPYAKVANNLLTFVSGLTPKKQRGNLTTLPLKISNIKIKKQLIMLKTSRGSPP